jgi:hypothetical protein
MTAAVAMSVKLAIPLVTRGVVGWYPYPAFPSLRLIALSTLTALIVAAPVSKGDAHGSVRPRRFAVIERSLRD